MFGFYNVVARVDATQKSFAFKVIPDEVLRKTLGGKGLATHLLLSYSSPKVDALDPGSHLVIAIGPASGTDIPGSCCHGIFTKSPRTGYYAESYAEDNVGECIAGTGFDAVIIHGASENPVWLEASEETIGFHAADHLWGLDAQETESLITAWTKGHRPAARKCGVVTIGPEDENSVAASAIRNDNRRPADCPGIRAVMASKKIKAVIFWGNRRKELANPDLVEHLARDLAQRATGHTNKAGCTSTHAPGRIAGAGSKLAPHAVKGDRPESDSGQCGGIRRAGRSTGHSSLSHPLSLTSRPVPMGGIGRHDQRHHRTGSDKGEHEVCCRRHH